jgi:hypothetical protein
MIYRPDENSTKAERQYITLYNSVVHHLVEALDSGNDDYASMLLCVLYGGFAGQFPEGSEQRSQVSFEAFRTVVTQEINQPTAEDILHDIPHVHPGWMGERIV